MAKSPRSSSKKTSRSRPKRYASPKTKLGALLDLADQKLGEIEAIETRDLLEKAVYLVLREGSTPRKTSKALVALREEFVNWNEVRLSRASELARVLTGSSSPRTLGAMYPVMQRVIDLIDQVYNDRNVCSLEFLLDDKPKGRLEYLEDLDDLGLHNAYALEQWLTEDGTLTRPASSAAKVAKKLGLVDTAAAGTVKKVLANLVPPERYVSLHAHLTWLGELEEDEWPAEFKEFLN